MSDYTALIDLRKSPPLKGRKVRNALLLRPIPP